MGIFTPNLQRLADNKNIDELVKLLGDRKSSVRYKSFILLSGMNIKPDVMGKLRQMMHDSDPRIRTVAALKYAGLDDASAFPLLLEIMDHGSPDDKIDLLRIISGRGVIEETLLVQIIAMGLIDKKEKVRNIAIKTAGISKNRHLVSYLGNMLQAEHHMERLLAAKALYDIGGEESVDFLVGLLADRHPEVHEAARKYLADVEDSYVKRALYDASFMKLISDMNDKEPVRERTAYRIGSEKIRAGLPLLYRACRDKYKGVRIQALQSIAIFNLRSSVGVVEQLLSDKFFDVRIEALNTLGKLGGPQAMKVIEAAFSDTNKNVRARAEQILSSMR